MNNESILYGQWIDGSSFAKELPWLGAFCRQQGINEPMIMLCNDQKNARARASVYGKLVFGEVAVLDTVNFINDYCDNSAELELLAYEIAAKQLGIQNPTLTQIEILGPLLDQMVIEEVSFMLQLATNLERDGGPFASILVIEKENFLASEIKPRILQDTSYPVAVSKLLREASAPDTSKICLN